MGCHICIYWTPEHGCDHYGPAVGKSIKNKGRKHRALNGFGGMNCKGCLTHVTRPISSMSSKGNAGMFEGKKKVGKFDKKKWIKRMRGYFKSQTKNI